MTISFSKGMMDVQRICVIHLNQIGDLVFSLPLLKALRDNFPASEIHSILRPYLQELLAHSPLVDELIPRKSGVQASLRLLRKIRETHYDLLVTLSNSPGGLFLAMWSGARIKAGFRNFPWDLGLDIKEEVEGHHSWYNNLKLLKGLNLEVKKRDYVGLLTLPTPEPYEGFAGSSATRPRGRYVVVAAGTSVRRNVKAWEEQKFGELILRLKEKYGLEPVLVGSKGDRAVNDRIIESIRTLDPHQALNSILNLAGEISLQELCSVMKEASLFVGVDSGIMHLASAFDIPVVGIFGPTDPFYVGPLNEKSVVVREEGIDCMPCYLKGCEDRKCLKRLDVTKVFRSCEQVLGS